MDQSLLEAILKGYKAIFTEGINSWSPFYFQGVNPNGEPMGSYQNIMKQVPSSIGAAGGAGNTTRGGNAQYQYGEALPGASRDYKKETMEEWEEPPKFKKFTKPTMKPVKKLIKKAEEHIPQHGESMIEPINYYSNYHMGNYDVDTRIHPF